MNLSLSFGYVNFWPLYQYADLLSLCKGPLKFVLTVWHAYTRIRVLTAAKVSRSCNLLTLSPRI